MRFKKASLKESRDLPGKNPGRGWYHLYYHMAEEEPDLEEMGRRDVAEESLVLPVINIGHFRHGPISGEGIAHIRKIFAFYHEREKDMVLRFSYDTAGKGPEREPWSRDIILEHMEQLGEAVRAYRNDILVIQGLFIGSWGEMHGSRYLTDGSMKKLLAALREAVGEEIPIALRRPCQLRSVRQADLNLCLYNDGMFGSESDLGTYGFVKSEEGKEEESWVREDELFWQDGHLDGRPNGGETVAASDPLGYRQAAQDLERMHVSYLNGFYHEAQLSHWKGERVRSGIFQGLSGFDYIGARLGYRFTLKKASLSVSASAGPCLELTAENTGFSANCEEMQGILWLSEREGQYTELAREDLPIGAGSGAWKMSFSLKEAAGKRGGLYFGMMRRKDGRTVYLANKGAGERLYVGLLK